MRALKRIGDVRLLITSLIVIAVVVLLIFAQERENVEPVKLQLSAGLIKPTDDLPKRNGEEVRPATTNLKASSKLFANPVSIPVPPKMELSDSLKQRKILKRPIQVSDAETAATLNTPGIPLSVVEKITQATGIPAADIERAMTQESR